MITIPQWMHRITSLSMAYRLSGLLRPWFLGLAAYMSVIAACGGLYVAPADYQQGDAYRIIFIHVPSAWMSLSVYATMAVSAFVAIVWRIKLAEIVVTESAVIGAAFTFITLLTGSLWGRPMWGTWWTWDARLTSELVMLFLYLGVIALSQAFDDYRQGARAAAFLTLIGAVNVPIVHFSVNWWNTLHQGSTIRMFGPSHIASSMLWPVLTMVVAAQCSFVASLFGRVRARILMIDGDKTWVEELTLRKVSP